MKREYGIPVPRARGKKHLWQFQEVFGETVLRCTRPSCGLIGEAEPVTIPGGAGFRGRPVFGCVGSSANGNWKTSFGDVE